MLARAVGTRRHENVQRDYRPEARMRRTRINEAEVKRPPGGGLRETGSYPGSAALQRRLLAVDVVVERRRGVLQFAVRLELDHGGHALVVGLLQEGDVLL